MTASGRQQPQGAAVESPDDPCVAALLALLRLLTFTAHLQVVPSPVFGGFPVRNLILVLFSGMCCLVPELQKKQYSFTESGERELVQQPSSVTGVEARPVSRDDHAEGERTSPLYEMELSHPFVHCLCICNIVPLSPEPLAAAAAASGTMGCSGSTDPGQAQGSNCTLNLASLLSKMPLASEVKYRIWTCLNKYRGAGSAVPLAEGSKPPVCARRARTVPRGVWRARHGGSSSAGTRPGWPLLHPAAHAPAHEKPAALFVEKTKRLKSKTKNLSVFILKALIFQRKFVLKFQKDCLTWLQEKGTAVPHLSAQHNDWTKKASEGDLAECPPLLALSCPGLFLSTSCSSSIWRRTLFSSLCFCSGLGQTGPVEANSVDKGIKHRRLENQIKLLKNSGPTWLHFFFKLFLQLCFFSCQAQFFLLFFPFSLLFLQLFLLPIGFGQRDEGLIFTLYTYGQGHSLVPAALLAQHTYPINNKAANEGTFPSCVPFTVKKLSLQRKPDPLSNSGKDKTCVVCRSVTTPGSKAVSGGKKSGHKFSFSKVSSNGLYTTLQTQMLLRMVEKRNLASSFCLFNSSSHFCCCSCFKALKDLTLKANAVQLPAGKSELKSEDCPAGALGTFSATPSASVAKAAPQAEFSSAYLVWVRGFHFMGFITAKLCPEITHLSIQSFFQFLLQCYLFILNKTKLYKVSVCPGLQRKMAELLLTQRKAELFTNHKGPSLWAACKMVLILHHTVTFLAGLLFRKLEIYQTIFFTVTILKCLVPHSNNALIYLLGNKHKHMKEVFNNNLLLKNNLEKLHFSFKLQSITAKREREESEI
ncbi:hypothetical protein IHE44_0003486 [Lamprotornis superbus]|uniref:Uncharacterized protein n=1 Tax=Lamprotornis superbus TaxID=245042 RepID=A0A835P2P9_9PASS|nr:hypothetical protein IHE44_0003486 [Lamprotornis superbus]